MFSIGLTNTTGKHTARCLKVTQLYRERIPDDAVVLDLMSSWVSHLPPEKPYKKVVGHGMNAAEVRRCHSLLRTAVLLTATRRAGAI